MGHINCLDLQQDENEYLMYLSKEKIIEQELLFEIQRNTHKTLQECKTILQGIIKTSDLTKDLK